MAICVGRVSRGTPYYLWHSSGPVEQKRSNTVAAPPMNPCFKRTYDATPTALTASWSADAENPTRSDFTGRIDVSFSVPPEAGGGGQDPMRVGSRVNNLPYTISYYIQHPSGATTPISNSAYTTIIASNSNRNSSGSAYVNQTFGVSVGGNVQVGDQICWTLYTTPLTQGQVDPAGTIYGGGGQKQSSQCTSPIQNEPYLRVYGGDVLAGSGFGSGCVVNTSAGIFGWNKGNGAGAGVQLAAQG